MVTTWPMNYSGLGTGAQRVIDRTESIARAPYAEQGTMNNRALGT